MISLRRKNSIPSFIVLRVLILGILIYVFLNSIVLSFSLFRKYPLTIAQQNSQVIKHAISTYSKDKNFH